MSVLGKWIASKTPKFNKEVVEGWTYNRLKNSEEFIDSNLKYTSLKRTKTKLKYLGLRVIPPEEYIGLKFKGGSNRTFDMAESATYLIEYNFQYGDEDQIRKVNVLNIHVRKGNKTVLGGKEWSVEPTLADKVISIGERQIFIDIGSAKHTFNRTIHTVFENNMFRNVPIIVGELYRNQVKRLDDTTNAKSTIMHYLLAYYGYSKTMEIVLGFVPKAMYGVDDREGKIVIESTGRAPDGFKGDQELYTKNKIMFVVDEEENTPELLYCLGNVLYILDNFPGMITIEQMEDPFIWRRFMGEIIFSGNHGIPFILNQMNIHFKGLNYTFDVETNTKLRDIGVEADNLIELLAVIFKNFNKWVASGDGRSLYFSKSLEVESYVLSRITSMFTKLYLDINKEELKSPNGILTSEEVDKAFRSHIREWAITGLRKDTLFVQSVEDTTDHLYFKGTAFVVKQESNSINAAAGGSNTSARHKLSASMATAGSLLYLSKKNPDPTIRQNPYVTIDPDTGTILPDPELGDIVAKTEKMLTQTFIANGVRDVMDDEDIDVEYDDDIFDRDEDMSDDWDDYDN